MLLTPRRPPPPSLCSSRLSSRAGGGRSIQLRTKPAPFASAPPKKAPERSVALPAHAAVTRLHMRLPARCNLNTVIQNCRRCRLPCHVLDFICCIRVRRVSPLFRFFCALSSAACRPAPTLVLCRCTCKRCCTRPTAILCCSSLRGMHRCIARFRNTSILLQPRQHVA